MSQSPSTLTDAELVQQAQGQSAEAFSHLVGRYERLVTSIVARVCETASETDKRVQDVFLDAFKRLGGLKQPNRFRGWLALLAVGRAESLRSAESGVRDAASLGEEKTRVADAISGLPQDAQAVVTLRYLEGLSTEEIATQLGITPTEARQRLAQAKGTLREQLGEDE